MARFEAYSGSAIVPVVAPASLIANDEVVVLMKFDVEGRQMKLLLARGQLLAAHRVLKPSSRLTFGIVVSGKLETPPSRVPAYSREWRT